ncbi:MAG TPA: serine/threonine-protein kinase [Polyangiaceae bacterium]|nr:serine/threonine-protein kinase [Polyangiaceae bacterium]
MTDALSTPDDDYGERAPAPGDVLAGKYRVESVVGAGGMGIVVAAQHLTLGQTVAVKLLRTAGLDEARRAEACARFLREGQAAARLASEHVVRIHDVGTLEDGAPFMVMELLRGNDLASILDGKGQLGVDAAIEYVLQVCDAVGEAHANGIVHRDLKPSNLFVSTRSDGRPLVKVLDFGISKAIAGADDPLQGNLTSTRSVVGSPYYMSPEQVRDAKRVDARSDIWSLGMILYELLVGEPAFNADTLPGICAAIAADTPPPIRDRRPDVSPELEAVIMRCLEKDPGRRFSTVIELVRALAPHAARAAGVSTADYASRRLEESAKRTPPAPRLRPDEATVHSGPDSGMRVSDRGARDAIPPSVDPVSAPSTAMPAVLRADTRTLQSPTSDSAKKEGAPRAQSTLVSRTGTSLPAVAEREPEGVVARAPTTERDSGRNRWIVLLVVALVMVAAAWFSLSRKSSSPVLPEETGPGLHEPVGPSPAPAPKPPIAEAAPVAPPVATGPVPAASLSGAASPSAPLRVAPKRVAPPRVVPPPAKPKPAAASDIRLER